MGPSTYSTNQLDTLRLVPYITWNFGWLLFAVVIGHLSAALLHAWIYRDGVFSSMALGSSSKKEEAD